MRNSVVIFLFAISNLVCLNMFSQDTILLINGKSLIRKVKGIDDRFVLCEKTLKHKNVERKMETNSVFSVKYSSGTEKILYKPDSSLGLTLSVPDMHAFVLGEKWAREKFHAPWSTVWGFVAGAVGGYYQFWGIPLPAVTAVAVGIVPPKSRHYKSFPAEYKDNPYFIAGYKDYGRKKKTGNAVKGGLIGFLSMTVVISYITDQEFDK